MSGHEKESQGHRFVGHAGQQFINGKTWYPDMLRLRLPRDDAFRLMRTCCTQLQVGDELEIELFGEMNHED